MSITKTSFGVVNGNVDIDLYTITNKAGASISVSTLGAGLVKIMMPSKNGNLVDCILGYDKAEDYMDPDRGYQGLVIGRCANRIAGGKFTLNGVEYNITKNLNNCLTLHGAGRLSFNKWSVEEIDESENAIMLSFFSPDMEDGFPGNFTCIVRYTLTEDNVVRIEYNAASDVKTIANITNHAYFNLTGEEGTIDDHYLKVNADYYTETGENIIPTGDLAPVENTPLDLTTIKRIGDGLHSDFADVVAVGGYDHCFCLRNKKGEFAECAVLEERNTGIRLTAYTDMPAVQVYTSNCMIDSIGKDGKKTSKFSGVCLETQMYPNAVNQPKFPSVEIDADHPLETTTEFRFTII